MFYWLPRVSTAGDLEGYFAVLCHLLDAIFDHKIYVENSWKIVLEFVKNADPDFSFFHWLDISFQHTLSDKYFATHDRTLFITLRFQVIVKHFVHHIKGFIFDKINPRKYLYRDLELHPLHNMNNIHFYLSFCLFDHLMPFQVISCKASSASLETNFTGFSFPFLLWFFCTHQHNLLFALQ